MAVRRIERHIYRDEVTGHWRVFVYAHGKLRGKRLPATLSLTDVRKARDDHAYAIRHQPAVPAVAVPDDLAGTFAGDAVRYLAAVRAMPTWDTRARHISEWVLLFGDRNRQSIAPHEIRAQRDRWLLEGPKLRQKVTRIPGERPLVEWVPVPEPLSASAVNHRLRALSNLYTVLDGRHAYNPVREVPEADPPVEGARGLPYYVVEAILAAMPERGQGLKGQERDCRSKTKARLRVIAYVGLAHCELRALQPKNVDFEARTIAVQPRKKGKRGRKASTHAVVKPLMPRGVAALREFDRLDCWGPFSASSMRMSFRRACQKAGYAALGARPYDFRHSFATGVYGASKDPVATQAVMAHRELTTTMRYARAAVNPAAVAALEKFQAALTAHERGESPGDFSGGKVPEQ